MESEWSEESDEVVRSNLSSKGNKEKIAAIEEDGDLVA